MGALTSAHQIYCDVAVHLLSAVTYGKHWYHSRCIKISVSAFNFIDATLLAVTCRPNTK